MNKLERKDKLLSKKLKKLEEERKRFNEKINKQMENLKEEKFRNSLKITHMNDLKQINCKHKKEYGRKKWPNMRDDASFEYYIACAKCDKVLFEECV